MEEPRKITSPNLYDDANFFSRLLLVWLWPLFNKGFFRDLDLKDLYTCSKWDDPEIMAARLEVKWEEEKKKHEGKKTKPHIKWAIIRAFGLKWCLFSPLTVIVEAVIRMFQPFMIGRVVSYLSSPDDEVGAATYDEAFWMVIGIVLTTFLAIFMIHHGFALTARQGNIVRSAITHLIYKKVMRMSMSSFSQTDVGQILNIISNDLNRFEELGFLLIYCFIGPLTMIISLLVTHQYLGSSSWAGFVLLILFVPFQACMGRLFGKYRHETIRITDKRVSLMSEIVSAMRLIKVYCWEKPFADLVAKKREEEIKALRKTYFLEGVNSAVFFVAAKVILFVCFVTYTWNGAPLTPEIVFVTMSVYNSSRVPATRIFPNAVSLGSEVWVALNRVNRILLLDEKTVSDNAVCETDDEKKKGKGVVLFNNYCAKWTKELEKDNLINISCDVVPGELLIVVGPVGSGKTCLLYALLNEVFKKSGECRVRGSLSYASQESWCFGGTIKQNILLGSEYNEERYNNVIRVCGLERDLGLFERRDDHFVGEKGYNLSGGQKARVSLARAVYRDSDIYILDDPLSAVDPKVANHIFTECIRGYLKDKTVILVTHQLQFLKQAAKILVLKEGKQTSYGSYNELISSSVEFLRFLDRKRKEEERKESLSKQRSLSLNAPVEATEETPPPKEKVLSEDVSRVEQKVQGEVSLKVFVDYFKSGRSKLTIVLVLVFSIVSQGFYHYTDMWVAAWTQHEADSVSNGTEFQKSLAASSIFDDSSKNLAVYGALIILLFIGSFLRMMACFYLALRCSINLHNTIFQKLLRANMTFFENNPVGRIMNRFTRDLGIVDTLIPRSTVELNLTVFDVSGVVALTCIVNYYLLIPTAILAVLSYPVREYYVRTARDIHRLDAIARSPLCQHLSASCDGLVTIRAFKLEKKCESQYIEYLRDSVACRFLVWYSIRVLGIGLDLLSNIYILCICFVLIGTPKDTMAGGDAGLILAQSLLLIGLFQYMMRMSSELGNQMTSAERVLEYAKIPSEAELTKEGKVVDNRWPSKGEIRFKGVSLRYSSDSEPVLKDLNFQVKAGEKIGIVGRTGAGKSSLISAIFRLVEPTGIITIDGVDISTLGLHELRQKISIIPQDPSLFSGSVRMNLDPFNEYKDSEIWSAMEGAHLAASIRSLSGLDAHVSEGGSNLSVGQRQLLCMARALLKKNKVLVMDEATANVDQETDELIQRTIKQTFRDNTVLTVAHRLNTIIDMDRVLVMDAGRVVEFDEPHELLQDVTGTFYSMVKQTGPEFSRMLHQMAQRSHNERERRAF